MLKVYEVGIVVTETWIMHVVASSKKEARRRANAGRGMQMYSTGGKSGDASDVKILGTVDELDAGGELTRLSE